MLWERTRPGRSHGQQFWSTAAEVLPDPSTSCQLPVPPLAAESPAPEFLNRQIHEHSKFCFKPLSSRVIYRVEIGNS